MAVDLAPSGAEVVPDPQPRRRPWRVVIGGLVGVGATAAGLTVLATRQAGDEAADRVPVSLTTVDVARQDLVLYDETTATLQFTSSVTVSSPVAGTVTTIVDEGDTIRAGSVVATIDGAPVVALVGDVPGWRDLSTSSSDGVDVRQLELNLVALGFDPGGTIVIDEEYDEATGDAVTRWEESLGLDADDEVDQSQVVYIGGTVLVDDVPVTVGASVSSGGSLVGGRQTERMVQVPAVAADAAPVTGFAASGTEVVTGTILFWNGLQPVVAIVGDASAVPALTRELSLGVDDGADVKLLEEMLRAGGFVAGGSLVVDDEFDAATVSAVLAWQQAIGVPFVDPTATDVVVSAGSFVVVPSGLEVGAPRVPDGTPVLGDAVVLHLTAPARVVSTTAPLGDETFAVGAEMEVVFPDGTTAVGTVTEVGTTASNAGGQPGETPTVPISIEVDQIPDSAASFVEIPVTLRIVTTSVPGALVVPVSALVALAEGGYAVETVTGVAADGSNLTALVGVETGIFSGGFVEVISDRLTADQPVVVPS